MAHELRTPLTSLKMILDVVYEQKLGDLNERQSQLLQQAREDCERISQAVTKHVEKSKEALDEA